MATTPDSSPGPLWRREWLELLLLLGVAGVARGVGLGGESLSVDEVFSYRLSARPLAEVWAAIPQDTHPPGYPLLLHLWWHLFGGSELALRSLSALAGTIAVGLAWGVARQARLSPTVRRLGIFLAAISPLLLAQARQARPHSLYLCLGMLSLWVFLQLHRRFRPGPAVGLMLVNALLLYTHYLSGPVVLAQAVAVLASLRTAPDRGEYLRQWAMVFGGTALLFAPWVPTVFQQLEVANTQLGWLQERGPWAAFGGLRRLAGPVSGVGTAALSILGLAAILGATRRTTPPVLGLWVLLGLGIPIAMVAGGRPVPLARGTLAVAPVLLLLAAGGLTRLGRWGVVPAVLLVSTTLFGLHVDRTGLGHRPWREAAEQVAAGSVGPEPVAFQAHFGSLAFDYYLPQGNRPYVAVDADVPDHTVEQQLRRGLGGSTRFWAVLSYIRSEEPLRQAAHTLGYRVLEEYRYPQGLTVIQYRRSDAP